LTTLNTHLLLLELKFSRGEPGKVTGTPQCTARGVGVAYPVDLKRYPPLLSRNAHQYIRHARQYVP